MSQLQSQGTVPYGQFHPALSMEVEGHRQIVHPILNARYLLQEALHAPLVLIDRLDAHLDPGLRWRVEGIEPNPNNQEDKVGRLSQVQPDEHWCLLCAP